MNCLLVFLIFSGVIATGSARKCMTCQVFGIGNDDCTGDLEECENDDDFCVKQIEYSLIDGDDRATVRKRCMSSANEDVCRTEPMKLDCKKMRFFLYSECCYEDGCNSDKIQMPAENTTKNGHQCPTCFVENKDACPEAKLEDCTGNANICLDFKGDITRPEDVKKRYAFKGCADKHLCETDLSKLPGCKVGNDATLTCT